ncbi:hypothetical protein ANCDUO_24138 [Ancylostoma duodenale]|uniref:PITH domain-containing protein n=1 Tax=Ancylostoma duodenale TaxID=51022 RepID=A0A0C2FLQ7_9BILA|nr:hypothetical protein ANCDUO_24138 [Ancylostoma duodenale]
MCDHNHEGAGGCHHEATDIADPGDVKRYDMHQYIDMDKVTVLNENIDGNGKLVFKNMERRLDKTDFVDSDCDEELLFNIPFCGQVRITGMSVIGDEDDSHPAKIRLFKDRPAVSLRFTFCSN